MRSHLVKIVGTVAAVLLPVAIVLAAPISVGGGSPGGVPQGTFGSFELIVQTLFNGAILISGLAFVGLFLVGGVMYLTAAGNEDNTTKARKLILDAIIGLVIVLAAWAVGGFVLQKLGITRLDTGDADINSSVN